MLLPRSLWIRVRNNTRPLCLFRQPVLHTPKRSPLSFRNRNLSVVPLRGSEGNEPESSVETEQDKPEHAVISTFDLFSIGGQCLSLSFRLFRTALKQTDSWAEQLTYSWANACGKNIRQRLARVGFAG